MNQLKSLREHILSLPGEIRIDPNDLVTYAEKGQVISTAEGTNRHFELRYQAHIIVQNYSAAADRLFYWVLIWLADNQPGHKPEAINWQADLLNHDSSDIAITIDINELIKVETTPEGIRLNPCGLPMVPTELLTAPQWQLHLAPNCADHPVAQWVNGG